MVSVSREKKTKALEEARYLSEAKRKMYGTNEKFVYKNDFCFNLNNTA